ncbi:glycosyltransferase family 2 protein [Paenibacillus aquistagni]|nr:glycosyltransferase [Paenibacillus aquistagni]
MRRGKAASMSTRAGKRIGRTGHSAGRLKRQSMRSVTSRRLGSSRVMKHRQGRRDRGFTRLTYMPPHPEPLVSVIIPVMNERATIARVVKEARKVHPAVEVIVVANGTNDGSDYIAERLGAIVLRHQEALGHDVGRTSGALAAKGQVLLFIDGDMIISAARLRPFIHDIIQGADVALNDYSGPVHKRQVHRVVLAKHALNALCSRPDLRGASMTAVPHAISRKALDSIGADALSIPPLAQATAIHKGLTVVRSSSVDVGRLNPIRARHFRKDPLEPLIDNDHLQSIRWLTEQAGSRGGYTDLGRNRQIVREQT